MELEPLDGESMLVTFSWHDEGDSVAVVGGPAGWRAGENLLEPDGSGALRRSYVVPRALRATYGFLRDPPAEPEWGAELWYAVEADPLNPATFVFPGDPEDPGWERDAARSVLEGPDAPPDAFSAVRPGVPRGTVRVERMRSEVLGNERRVWLYTPPGHDAAAGEYALLLVFDGWAYTQVIPTPTILDNLVADGAVPPLVAVLPDSLDGATRERELCCDDAFLAFVTDELLPWARREGSATDDPARTIAAGSSAGGLAAAFAAWRRPDVVGNVLSQSGAFWWGREGGEPEWLTARLAEAEPPFVRFWLEAGSLEGESLLEANRRLRDVLVEGAADVTYAEFAGGHDYLCWQVSLAAGLRALAAEPA